MKRCGFPAGFPLAAGLAMTFLAWLAPSAPSSEPAPMPQKVVTVEGITEYKMDNGLRILLFPDSSASKVTVNSTVLVGSRHEGYGETGMAHLLEHMVFKGTPNHPHVPKDLRDRGAQFNGTTSYDRTNYFETLDANDDNLEFAIYLESDRLVNSFIKREDLASEMTVVRNEFEAGENSPPRILNQRIFHVAYEWHNYGKNTIGNRSDIERVPIEKLQAFYRKFYQPDNVLLIVTGNFKPEKALSLIAKYYGPIKKPERVLDTTYTEEPTQDGDRSVILRRVGSVGVVGAVYHIPAAAHPDSAALDVLGTMLSAEPNGRLYQALVVSKKASRVSSDAYTLHDPGVFVTTALVDKSASVEEARDALLDTLEKLGTEKLTDAEVDRAKTKLGREYERLMANSNGLARELSEAEATGDWRLFFIQRDRVAKVTPADVSRVAKQYLMRSNRTVGMFIPTEGPERAAVPATPDIAELVKEFKGGETVAAGEFFDPTAENIQKRTEYTKLGTGVKAALLPKKTRGELATLTLSLRYGNADSLKGNGVAAQMLGTLLSRGTKKHTRQEIEDELDRLKAKISSAGGLGQITFSIECKRESLPTVLGLLTEMLREPSFPTQEFDVVKRQLREGLEQSRTEPQPLAIRALQRKLSPYPKEDVRYVPTVEESIERLEATTLEQVRKLYEEQVGGEVGEFAAVGDFDRDPTVKQVEEALKGWKAKTDYKRIERPFVDGVKADRIVIETPDKANAVYAAGLTFALSDSDPEDAALEVADFLFGGGALSSRLGNRIRQKEGLSYGVRSIFAADALDKSSLFRVFAITNPKNIDKVDAAFLDELDKMLKSGVGDTEITESKKAYLAEMKANRSTDGQLAGELREALYAGRTFAYVIDLEKKIDALTADQVSAAFRAFIDPKKLVIVEAGDFKKKG